MKIHHFIAVPLIEWLKFMPSVLPKTTVKLMVSTRVIESCSIRSLKDVESIVTRKITMATATITIGKQECLYLGNLNAQRD